MKTIADHNPAGDRPVDCECGHHTVGDHNFAVTRLSVDHGVAVR